MKPELCVHRAEVRQRVNQLRQRGKRVGVVPTMGALHQGHLSLVEASGAECDFTVVTIFVNPTQFGPGEDFDRYPRDLDRDMAALEGQGAGLVYAPTTKDLYRQRHSTYIDPPAVAKHLEGALRPGHFRGVATIVLKLLQIIPADAAFFGQKDYQQTRVIEDMVADLDLPVSIKVCPIVREADGLALSSRNIYLSADQRQQALALSQSLRQAATLFRRGETNVEPIQRAMETHLHRSRVTKIDYVALVDPLTLEPVVQVDARTMALVAAYVGKARLIDNMRLGDTG